LQYRRIRRARRCCRNKKETDVRCSLAACALVLALAAHHSPAQPYPSKLIRLVVPFPPGGTTDVLGRILGQRMGESTGVQILVENRPGAAGMIGADFVAKSPPDGYTLVSVVSAHVVHPSLYRKVPFDPVKDFVAITMLMRAANVVCVHPQLPAHSVEALVAMAQARPGELVFGTSGIGTSNHLTGELFKLAAKIDIRHVPYKGGGPSVTDLVGGQIPMTLSQMLTVTPFIAAGKIRPLAVTGKAREATLPKVPTLMESGYPGFEAYEWSAVLGPAGMSREIVARLNAEVDRAMKLPDVQERLAAFGTHYIGTTPDETAAYMRSEMDKWSKVIRSAGLKPE